MRGEERRTPPCQHTALLFLGAVNGAVIVQLWAVCVPILCVCVCVYGLRLERVGRLACEEEHL